MTNLPDRLLRYFQIREQHRADEIAAVLTGLTERERALVREAAVMGSGDDRAEPAIQRGRRPAMTYLPWWRSQTVNLGATARDAHYWQCPKTGCRVWAGPYSDPSECKQVGMDHVYYEHDLPAARAAEQRRAAFRSARR